MTLRLFISENQLHFGTTLLFYQHPSTRLFTMAHHTDGCRVDGHLLLSRHEFSLAQHRSPLRSSTLRCER
jgi:hypothetical protein